MHRGGHCRASPAEVTLYLVGKTRFSRFTNARNSCKYRWSFFLCFCHSLQPALHFATDLFFYSNSKLFWCCCIIIDVADILDIVHCLILKFPSLFTARTWIPRSNNRVAVSDIHCRVNFLSPFYLKTDMDSFSEISCDFWPDMKDEMCEFVRSLLPSLNLPHYYYGTR